MNNYLKLFNLLHYSLWINHVVLWEICQSQFFKPQHLQFYISFQASPILPLKFNLMNIFHISYSQDNSKYSFSKENLTSTMLQQSLMIPSNEDPYQFWIDPPWKYFQDSWLSNETISSSSIFWSLYHWTSQISHMKNSWRYSLCFSWSLQ